jgi:LPXTG-motif cell wall-anchored protein
VELNIDPSDPDSPATGDNAQIVFWISVMGVSFVLLLILIVARKKKEEEEKQ